MNAGIYIHIPFCKNRCIYCDFFSTTHLNHKTHYVNVLCNELEQRKDYLNKHNIGTIYFGGGTPSLLSFPDFEKIFRTIQENFLIEGFEDKEITIEANPEDVNDRFLTLINCFSFNRISLGVQSFRDEELIFLGRKHDAYSAVKAVENCQKKGFLNINVDLIYGLPGQSLKAWETTVQQAISLNISHISAYHLTYEQGTKLDCMQRQGLIRPVDELESLEMFEILIDKLLTAGFEHYEISNFASPTYYSMHNIGYWNGSHYLGVGASAHSYNGKTRQWNRVDSGRIFNYLPEIEIMNDKTTYNDFIITRIRTMKGIDLDELLLLCGEEKKLYCLNRAEKYMNNHLVQIVSNHLQLTRKGLFVSDGIMCDLLS
ncbi:MAG: radical SAM family heme chaperone HemW [Candidatus Azobacteroides pseudotrichonymphae]|jgi:oxygen-independent coproporphyrinogen-3 oxidase|nr:radical SAM family heme chaperone HemW [Bacteroidales bacterium OttesenSCG-928-I14]GMO34640.1 MAG: radical SAM family heme chaperone HemW [Candidatus Azobacteroides pseudotrichonymphae]